MKKLIRWFGISLLGLAGSGFAANRQIESQEYLFKQISTPANPASGKTKVYSKSGSALYWLTSAGTESKVNDATALTGVIPIANGGSNKALTLSAGGIVWTDADSFEVVTAGSSSQALISNGTSAPSWLTYGSSNANSTLVSRDGSGNFAAGTITAALTGNATTATALAANPTDCASDTYATTIAASGNLTCSTISLAGGGTGQTTKAAAFDALSPMTTSGDIIYGGASGTGTRLAKGSDGTVLTLASGIPSWASPSAAAAPNSEIMDTVGAGHGSTDTMIRRIETNVKSVGTSITVAYSATLGNVYTIVDTGIYCISYSDRYDGGQYFIGISVNSSARTTAIGSLTYAQGKRAQTGNSASNPATAQTCLHLTATDTVRPHTDGNAAWTGNGVIFTITRIQ